MLELPNNPIVICRKCLSQVILHTYPLNCPKCGYEESASQVQINKLLKFYPRLIAAQKLLAGHGFKWDSYTFSKNPLTRVFYFKDLQFHCAECDKTFSIAATKVPKFAKEPGLFCCPKCRKHPKLNKDTKEIFVAFDSVNLAAGRLIYFQFDLFLPLGLHHSDYGMQASE